MTSRERLLTAWNHEEPDRVPIELQITPAAYEYPEAERIVEFIRNRADNFMGTPAMDFGFCGLPAEYTEERIEDVPDDFYRLKRTYRTEAGEFYAITKHSYHELLADLDFHWERRYIDDLDDMARLSEAPRPPVPVFEEAFSAAVEKIGGRGVPMVGVFHPLGWLVRNANMEEVYLWFAAEPAVMHRYLERTNEQVREAVSRCHEAGIGSVFTVTAHEMLLPPWVGPSVFDEFVFPYDKRVNDEIHRGGGRLRIHCHGNVVDFLERFVEMGVDSMEPLEPPPFGDVDLAHVKRLVGDRMLLSGNITSNNFLSMSTRDVRDMVKKAVSDAAPGGGFSLRTTGGHASTNSAKSREQMIKILANTEAYMDAALEFGEYPIKR